MRRLSMMLTPEASERARRKAIVTNVIHQMDEALSCPPSRPDKPRDV